MNLPPNIERPNLSTIEDFVHIAASLSDVEKRTLYALTALRPGSNFEAVAGVAGVGMLEISGIVRGVMKLKPRDELLAFDPREKAFVFKKATDAETFAEIHKFADAFCRWCADPDCAKALSEAEGRRVAMFEARRASA